MNIKEIIYWPILSGSLFGEISLGMSLKEFKLKYVKTDYVDHGFIEEFPIDDGIIYLFYDCISFVFGTEKLWRINLSKGYQGKVENSIRLGSSLLDVSKATDRYMTDGDDDEYWLEYDDSTIDLEVTNDFQWERTDEELEQCKVTKMVMETMTRD